MEREAENDERTPEVDNQSRQGDGDESDATPDQMGASGTRGSGTGGSGGGSSKSSGSRTAGTSGGERPESTGNEEPNRAASDKTS
jgi:hypothetical protein